MLTFDFKLQPLSIFLREFSHHSRVASWRYRIFRDSRPSVTGSYGPCLVRPYPHRSPVIALRRQGHRVGTKIGLVILDAKGFGLGDSLNSLLRHGRVTPARSRVSQSSRLYAVGYHDLCLDN